MRNKNSKFFIFGLFVALLLFLAGGLSGSIAEDKVSAAGATPPSDGTTAPAYAANQYTMKQIKTDSELGYIKAGSVTTVDGTKPSLTTTYTPGSPTAGTPADPYKGGTLAITWKNNIKWTTIQPSWSNKTESTADSIKLYGLGFVGLINLPEGYSADNFFAAIDASSSYIRFGDYTQTLNVNTLYVTDMMLRTAGTRTLRFSFGDKDLAQDISANEAAKKAMLTDLFNNLSINPANTEMELHLQVDVAKLTKDGDQFDTSPDKVLTKGKLLPSFKTPKNLSVDFFDSYHTTQQSGPIGRFYPNLTNGVPVDVGTTNHVVSAEAIPSWRQYISPYDTDLKYNNVADPTEYVDGLSANLTGTTGNRSVILDKRDGRFADLDPDRFNRVVDFYTGKSVLGVPLSHTPTTTPAINTATKVWYSGTGSDGKALSPVALTVTETSAVAQKDAATDLFNETTTLTNENTGASGTDITASASDVISEEHTLKITDLGKTKFPLYDANNDATEQSIIVRTPAVSDGGSTTLVANSVTINGQAVTYTLLGNRITIKLGSRSLSSANGSVVVGFKYTIGSFSAAGIIKSRTSTLILNNQTQLGDQPAPSTITQFDPETVSMLTTTKMTNVNTGSTSTTAINAAVGDKITQEHTFTLTKLGLASLPVVDGARLPQKITLKKPAGTTLDPDSVELNGTKVDVAEASDGSITVPLTSTNILAATNAQATIKYSYTLARKIPTGTTISTATSTFTSYVSDTPVADFPVFTATAPTAKIGPTVNTTAKVNIANTLRNVTTGEAASTEPNRDISAGDEIEETYTITPTTLGAAYFTSKADGTPAINQGMVITIPNYQGTTMTSVTLNGVKKTPYSVLGETLLPFDDEGLSATTKKIKVTVAYTVDTFPASNFVTTVKPDFQVGAQVSLESDLDTIYTLYQKDTLPTITKVPTRINFGTNNILPFMKTTFVQRLTSETEMEIGLKDNTPASTPWQLNLAVSSPFAFTSKLSFKGNILSATETPIYASTDTTEKGDIIFNKGSTDKFKLEVDDASGAEPDTTYTAELTWTLSSGPTS